MGATSAVPLTHRVLEEIVMQHCSPRSVAAIDAELRVLRDVCSGARGELAEVRRRQSELADLEAELVVSMELRSRRIDDVLDERLRAVHGAGEALRSPRLAPHPALAGVRSG
jgi:hypothetical protein